VEAILKVAATLLAPDDALRALHNFSLGLFECIYWTAAGFRITLKELGLHRAARNCGIKLFTVLDFDEEIYSGETNWSW
jgi:hypothetical protein